MKIYFFIFFLFLSFAYAQQIPNYQDKYVNDLTNVLSQQQVSDLRELFYFVDQNTTAEIVFLSVQTCLPDDPSSYALQVFDSWKIGKADKDNGLLILFCNNETKIFAMTGYGLEGILPDSKLGRFLDEFYVPQRDSGNISQGIEDFSKAISNEILANSDEVLSSQKNVDYFYVIIFIFILLLIGLLIYSFSNRRNKGPSDFLLFFFIDFLFRMIIYSLLFRGNNRNSNGGFSGGGFGGGMSGGGGASR